MIHNVLYNIYTCYDGYILYEMCIIILYFLEAKSDISRR